METNNTNNINTNNIRKYKKKVNKNGWKANIYRWTFSREPNYVGYCPFFWITLFCVIVSPFSLVGKILEFIWKLICDLFTPEKEESVKNPEYKWEKHKYKKPCDEVIVDMYDRLQKFETLAHYSWNNLLTPVWWAEQNPDWKEKYYPTAKINVDKKKAREIIKQNRKTRHKERMAIVVKYTSYTMKPLVTIAILTAAFYIYKLIFAIVSLIKWKDVVVMLTYSGISLLVCLGIVLAALLVSSVFVNTAKVVKYKWDAIPTKPITLIPDREWKSLTLINTVLTTILTGIFEGIEFVIETIKMTYKKECPLIEWSDEEAPIKRNDRVADDNND